MSTPVVVGEAGGKREQAKWWRWLPIGGFAAYGFLSGHPWVGASWTLVVVLGLSANIGRVRAWWRGPLLAYALNWFAPALLTWSCVACALRHDYWGVAFFTVILGLAVVNATYLEPSPRRSLLYRILVGILVLVSVASIYAYMTSPH